MEPTAIQPIHPIFSRVPDEVFYQIFEQCVQPIQQPAVQATVLSHVCRAWRTFAFNAPTLWRRILIIEDLETDTIMFDKTLTQVSHFLRLSRSCPLEICICMFSYDRHLGVEDPDDPYTANLQDFCTRVRVLSTLLWPNMQRIKSLEITCDEVETVYDLFSFFPDYLPMPQLEVLTICNTFEEQALDEDLDDPMMEDVLTVLSAPPGHSLQFGSRELYPRLKTVMIQGVPLEWSRFCPQNLEVLTLGYLPRYVRPSDAVLNQILSGSKDTLQSLSLRAFLGGPSSKKDPISLSLPNLQHLCVGFTRPEEAIPFFSKVRAPAVRTLELQDVQPELTSLAERQRLPYPTHIQALIDTIIDTIPLHLLHELNLENIPFCFPQRQVPPPPPPHTELPRQYVWGVTRQPISVHCFQFFSKLISARSIAIHNPDCVTLNVLNFLPSSNTDTGDTDIDTIKFPKQPILPALTALELSGGAFHALRTFLETRRWGGGMYRDLSLTMGIPMSWQSCFHLDGIPNLPVCNVVLLPDAQVEGDGRNQYIISSGQRSND